LSELPREEDVMEVWFKKGAQGYDGAIYGARAAYIGGCGWNCMLQSQRRSVETSRLSVQLGAQLDSDVSN
jgi:hypothetical protein